MEHKPIVFVSSVVHTLEYEREYICNLISKVYKWECIASDFSEYRFWGDPFSACRGRVEDADLYIGIFSHRWGSAIAPDNLSFTELEFYRALNLRKPILIYILKAEPEKALESFLQIQRAECLVRECQSVIELKTKVRKDLDFFEECWNRGDISSLIPTYLIDIALKKLGVLKDEFRSYGLSVSGSVLSRFDKELISGRVNLMRRYFEREEYPSAADIGGDLIYALFSAGLSYENKELLSLWAELLEMWAGSCTWLGYVGGDYGALRAALMRKEAYRVLESWHDFKESHHRITNCYNVLASKKQAESLYATSAKEVAEIERRRQSILERALDYEEQYRVTTGKSVVHLDRAHIYREQGKYDLAEEDFRAIADYRFYNDERGYQSSLVNLGYTLVLKGLAKELQHPVSEGISCLQRAEQGLQQYSKSPYYVSSMKKIAQGYLIAGEKEIAQQLLKSLLQRAYEERLTHQADTIQALIMKYRL